MKTIKSLMILSMLLASVVSCKKETYCASCEELKSHYKAASYCGTLEDVNAYIDKLKKQGAVLKQNWQCYKNKE